NPADIRLIAEMLSEVSPGFQLLSATRLSAACERIAADRIDVILLDLFLPDSNGLSTFRQVRAAAPSLPIVVLTGMDDESPAGVAVREGAQDYLPKGQVAGPLLSRAIRYAIERQRAERTLRDTAVSLRKLSHAVEQSPSVVMVMDLDGRIEY